ncbi:MAG: hypothetical protein V3T77_08760, partial [Planctomycetota bacterium]
MNLNPMNLTPGADLHVHSCFSDGLEEPAELLRLARGRLSLLSICDHDTIRAYDDLPSSEELHVLPGIEISTRHQEHSVHLLGYFPNGFTNTFRHEADRLQEARRERILAGIHKLRERGIPLRKALLEEIIGVGVPCRSHVARALIRMGMARSIKVIFERYLNDGGFGKAGISTTDAIALVRCEGGVPVWAHPVPQHVEEHGAELAEAGLQGLEVYLPRPKAGTRR